MAGYVKKRLLALKQVPNANPNADGVMVLRWVSYSNAWSFRQKWDAFTKSLPRGHHCVGYRVLKG